MEDHDLLIRIDERMDNIEAMLNGGKETFKTHDERIRDLEQSQSKIMGIVIVIGTAAASGIHVVLWLWDKIRWK
jgi:hypothetical protein